MPVRWAVVSRGISSPALVDLMSSMAEGSGGEPSVLMETFWAFDGINAEQKTIIVKMN